MSNSKSAPHDDSRRHDIDGSQTIAHSPLPTSGPYAELHCLSNFSFQRGASSARELFARAAQLGYTELAITDECSLAGIVRAWDASRDVGVRLIVGSELRLEDGTRMVLLVENHAGYTELCRLITLGRSRASKGAYFLHRHDLQSLPDGLCLLWCPGALSASSEADRDDQARWVAQCFPGRAWIAVELHRGPDDAGELHALRALGRRHALPLVAAGDVHMHVRERRALQDVLTSIRLRTPLSRAGTALLPNGERHLRRREILATLYPADLLQETQRISARCQFRLDSLDYTYPDELVPLGLTPAEHLRRLTWRGAARRWPADTPASVAAQIDKELALIAHKRYEPFFLTVEDIVRYARSRGILCQGRGSAANSAVCYCLGITSVAPDKVDLLFERFISRQRDEPPDIDVDFEHERREEVLQYVFTKYGRDRAALAATVISYRGKSAARDVGRALGFSEDQVEQLAPAFARGHGEVPIAERLAERGFDPHSRVMRQLIALLDELIGFPRHLSQHVGGFVISQQPLNQLVPVENAAMQGRSVIQWDKDDLESLGLLKVDCLALGMLTCLRKSFDLLRAHEHIDMTLAQVPPDDAATYAMIRAADTIGTFQIESRAQMSMLPRLRPRCYYDLVVQVAIVRPGPIQGGMVHPYLARRQQPSKDITYASPAVQRVLGRTLGVPIFQEQVMSLLQAVADFSADEADDLRRSMAAWKRRGGVEKFEPRIRARMTANGYSAEYAEQIISQIRGFGSYGFPESHAASFALLAYASCWLKCHHPALYACALLNSQPMGFYAPAQIVQDLRRHGVEVRAVDVQNSDLDCTLERKTDATTVLRLGLRLIQGMSADMALRITSARRQKPFDDLADLCHRAGLARAERQLLARAGALRQISGHRHRAYWDSAGIERASPLFSGTAIREAPVSLRPPTLADDVLADYATQGLSLQSHPVALARPALRKRRMQRTADLSCMVDGSRVRIAGLVTVRQRPQTASGVTFVTLEDETGQTNVVIWRRLAERQRRVLLESVLLGVSGRLQESEGVRHLVAHHLHDLSTLLPHLSSQSRDFH